MTGVVVVEDEVEEFVGKGREAIDLRKRESEVNEDEIKMEIFERRTILTITVAVSTSTSLRELARYRSERRDGER